MSEGIKNRSLLERRNNTIGRYSPLFYKEPLHLVSAEGVWLHDADGVTYLDGYNNVPHVGHCNKAVVEALTRQAKLLNINTRYLSEPLIDYAEKLLGLFPEDLSKVFFVNSGSEANELAIRITRYMTGHKGILISDWSYHGNSYSLARMTTGLKTAEGIGPHVRPIRIPDVTASSISPSLLLEQALDEVDKAILSLKEAGYGVAMFLFDPLFSTEGLINPPQGYIEGVVQRVHDAGGLVVADEVQSGFGRSGEKLWGFELYDIKPDLVTMGKPMGNGHPLGGVVTRTDILDAFASHNDYFNTFAGNPVSAAVGLAVLNEMERMSLKENAADLAQIIMPRLQEMVQKFEFCRFARGRGLFFGLEILTDDGKPDSAKTKALVELMKTKKVVISKIGRFDNVLKIRPPMVFNQDNAEFLLDTLEDALAEV